MHAHSWKRGTGLTLGLILTAGSVQAQAPVQAPAQKMDMPGPIHSLADLQDTGKILFKVTDENNDGQISQKEAIDAGNLLVGGFFFRADANGDGVLSPEEAKQARESFLSQHPIARILIQSSMKPAGATGTPGAIQNPAAMLATFLDTNNDKQLQATELRQAVQTTVQAFYAMADTNRDGQLSPTEVNAAMIGMANAAALAAFQAADTDHNGQLSQAEFDKAIEEPAHAIFRAVDTNHDNQLSAQEAEAARNIVMTQLRNLRVPEPANSVRNLIRSGASPEQIAPVPTFTAPAGTATPAPVQAQPQPAPTAPPQS